MVLDHLRNAAEKHHLTFGPDPATHDRCTLGGMIGNNSCGVHSVMAGKTDDNIEALDVLTYDGLRLTVGKTSDAELEQIIGEGGRRGEIYAGLKSLRDKYSDLVRQRYPNIPRRVSGYNLNYLLPENGFDVARALVGAEGTCVTVLEATCRLVESPPARVLLLIAYPDIFQCADHVPEVMAHKPIGLEGIDDLLVEYTRRKGINSEGLALLPEGGGWLLAEFGADTVAAAEAQAAGLMEELGTKPEPAADAAFHRPRANQASLGSARIQPGSYFLRSRRGPDLGRLGRLGRCSGKTGQLPARPAQADEQLRLSRHALRTLRRRLRAQSHQLRSGIEGGHRQVPQVHGRGRRPGGQLRRIASPASTATARRAPNCCRECLAPELLQAFREFKNIWDPDWKMNPGKVIEPYRMDENLRLGADYKPWQPETHFQFPHDQGSLARATLRCVGVGKCRRDEGGVMCPSFRVTHEEEHSTRGRAHLLWEMAQGDVIRDGWRDEVVKESLDLCLSCKGCKSDCPVSVDLATYKAEFLSHYHEGRLRPRSDYAFANIDIWARLASKVPGLVNLATQLPCSARHRQAGGGHAAAAQRSGVCSANFSRLVQARGSREIPKLRRSCSGRTRSTTTFCRIPPRPRSKCWKPPDFACSIPEAILCCGRPLYDFGMLDRAKRLLLQTLDALAPEIEAEIPIVVLEPSCAAVFRDELTQSLPRR